MWLQPTEPRIREWDAEREIRAMPFYHELSIHDPAAYEQVKTIVIEAVRSGDSKEKMGAKISDALVNILPKYLPKASDNSVVAYVNWTVLQLDALDHTNPDACYALMFPHKFGEPGFALKYIDPKSNEPAVAILQDVVSSAISNPQAEPDPAKSEEVLQQVLTPVVQKYGRDLSLLLGTPKDASERKKVCEMSSDLLREILALPKPDASLVFRYLLSAKT